MWEKTNTLPSNTSKFSSSESPKSVRKRFGSASEETILKVNGLSEVAMSIGPTEIESLKSEIVKEVKKEISKMKQDIIDGKHYIWVILFNCLLKVENEAQATLMLKHYKELGHLIADIL